MKMPASATITMARIASGATRGFRATTVVVTVGVTART